ncbi:hypothetical protein CTI12_AA505100 [Artemisia annua]|uniref:Uncharacterized protein n=1 Tax=Artemisia annua TaxID=35608 RepID=A0A2U1LCS4_ARTAN|nr:hypothetical protein CTI12_AA505100 [Artemisia annua]
MAPKRQRRPINKSPMSGSFKTTKKAKKPTIVGESPVFQQIVNQQLEALMLEIGTHCPFFSWVDPPMCARAVAIIPGLLASRNALEQSLNAMAGANRRLKIWLICSWIFFMIFYLM